MLADQLDYVVGVDPHRDSHALAVVHVVSGAVVLEATVAASSDGYAAGAEARRGARAGSARVRCRGNRLVRCRSDALPHAVAASGCSRWAGCGGSAARRQDRRARRGPRRPQRARAERPATPRAGGERQALQALVAAREGAVNAKRAGLCQLRDLLITTPEPLRSELRPLTRARLLQRLAATRPDRDAIQSCAAACSRCARSPDASCS